LSRGSDDEDDQEAHVFNSLMAIPPREWAKWCAYALVLLTPGSFVIVPLFCLVRHGMVRVARLKAAPGSASREAPQRIN
jgi:hypothetical protein